jgi:nicotinamidase-related amidase
VPGSLVAGRTALIVVDLMPRIVEQDLGPYKGADVVARASRLVAAFRRVGELSCWCGWSGRMSPSSRPAAGSCPELEP